MQDEIDARIKEDDGAFWMSFDDFVSNFYSVNVCMNSVPLGLTEGGRPISQARQHWAESRNKFEYNMVDVDDSRHVCCYSYTLTLPSDTDNVFVSVHQKDVRCKDSRPYIDIGVTVMEVDPSSASGLRVVASTGNSCDRQNQTNSLTLIAGQYIIMPTSTGCKLPMVGTNTKHHYVSCISLLLSLSFVLLLCDHAALHCSCTCTRTLLVFAFM
jgi:Calpain large subunit, domain III